MAPDGHTLWVSQDGRAPDSAMKVIVDHDAFICDVLERSSSLFLFDGTQVPPGCLWLSDSDGSKLNNRKRVKDVPGITEATLIVRKVVQNHDFEEYYSRNHAHLQSVVPYLLETAYKGRHNELWRALQSRSKLSSAILKRNLPSLPSAVSGETAPAAVSAIEEASLVEYENESTAATTDNMCGEATVEVGGPMKKNSSSQSFGRKVQQLKKEFSSSGKMQRHPSKGSNHSTATPQRQNSDLHSASRKSITSPSRNSTKKLNSSTVDPRADDDLETTSSSGEIDAKVGMSTYDMKKDLHRLTNTEVKGVESIKGLLAAVGAVSMTGDNMCKLSPRIDMDAPCRPHTPREFHQYRSQNKLRRKTTVESSRPTAEIAQEEKKKAMRHHPVQSHDDIRALLNSSGTLPDGRVSSHSPNLGSTATSSQLASPASHLPASSPVLFDPPRSDSGTGVGARRSPRDQLNLSNKVAPNMSPTDVQEQPKKHLRTHSHDDPFGIGAGEEPPPEPPRDGLSVSGKSQKSVVSRSTAESSKNVKLEDTNKNMNMSSSAKRFVSDSEQSVRAMLEKSLGRSGTIHDPKDALRAGRGSPSPSPPPPQSPEPPPAPPTSRQEEAVSMDAPAPAPYAASGSAPSHSLEKAIEKGQVQHLGTNSIKSTTSNASSAPPIPMLNFKVLHGGAAVKEAAAPRDLPKVVIEMTKTPPGTSTNGTKGDSNGKVAAPAAAPNGGGAHDCDDDDCDDDEAEDGGGDDCKTASTVSSPPTPDLGGCPPAASQQSDRGHNGEDEEPDEAVPPPGINIPLNIISAIAKSAGEGTHRMSVKVSMGEGMDRLSAIRMMLEGSKKHNEGTIKG